MYDGYPDRPIRTGLPDRCQLSREIDHHLFGTLYHAVALSFDGAVLVTADECYYAKASRRGGLVLLRDLP